MKTKSVFVVFLFSCVLLSFATVVSEEFESKEVEGKPVEIQELTNSFAVVSRYYDSNISFSGDYLVAYSSKGSVLRFKPVSLEVGGHLVGAPANGTPARVGDSFVLRDYFGSNIDLTYQPEETKLKELIQIGANSLPAVEDLNVTFLLDYSNNTLISLDGETPWDGNKITTSGDIHFIRNKEPHTLYVVNKYYRILAPYSIDALNATENLTYTLHAEDDKTYLTLSVPKEVLENAAYPLTLDPTIEFDDDGDYFYMRRNNKTCGTYSENCTRMEYRLPPIQVKVQKNCDNNDPNAWTDKSLFEFNIEGLSQYGGSLYSAELRTDGTCSNEDEMEYGYDITISEIGEFFGSELGCEDHLDDVVLDEDMIVLMDKYSCPGETDTYTNIKPNLEEAMYNEQDNIAFKLDMSPPYEDDMGPTNTFYYQLSMSKLEINYSFTCDYSDDCPSTEFCKNVTTEVCEDDLNYGISCENVATDNDSLACKNNNCKLDDFDNVGHYCARSEKCVHDGTEYESGYEHCNSGGSWYKTCSAPNWGSQVNCDYGCTSGMSGGCNFPDINVNPTTITFNEVL